MLLIVGCNVDPEDKTYIETIYAVKTIMFNDQVKYGLTIIERANAELEANNPLKAFSEVAGFADEKQLLPQEDYYSYESLKVAAQGNSAILEMIRAIELTPIHPDDYSFYATIFSLTEEDEYDYAIMQITRYDITRFE